MACKGEMAWMDGGREGGRGDREREERERLIDGSKDERYGGIFMANGEGGQIRPTN